MGWSDIGNWAALRDAIAGDGSGNRIEAPGGSVELVDCHNVLARTDGPRLSVIGLSDVAVIVDGRRCAGDHDGRRAEGRQAVRRHAAIGESRGQTMIAQTIQLALAPVFVLVAIGNIMNILSGRLGRVVDRSRVLQQRHGETEGQEHDAVVREIRIVDVRIKLIGRAILLLVLSGLASA
jgi:hypothetical protein